MAQPVWVLSVDLQTKTATFQTGLADAAKSARGTFGDIKAGANEMGGSVGYSMGEARHSVMLLGEEFGIHIPRALTSFIAGLGPIGPALEAAFPFLAIAVGATLLIEHLVKMQEAGEKLTDDQMKFGTTVQNTYNTLDERLIQAGIKADELRKDHLGALKGELELIDRQGMNELVHAFETVAKAADVVMKDLEGHWYTWGKGSEGAKSALEKFQLQYASLEAQGKSDEMSGLLHGTAKQAQDVLQALRDTEAFRKQSPDDTTYQKGISAARVLQGIHVETGVTLTKQIEAQQNLVDSLNAQLHIEQQRAALTKLQSTNATTTEHQRGNKEAEQAAEEAMTARQEASDAEIKQLRAAGEKTVLALNEAEREKIDATRQGTAARLQAVTSAIADEESWGLKDSSFFRQLLLERITEERAATEEEKKLKAEAGKEEVNNDERMGMLMLAAKKQRIALEDGLRRVSAQQRAEDDIRIANDELAIKMHAWSQEYDLLDKTGKDYQNKLKAMQDQEVQIIRAHANQIAAIKEKAEAESDQNILHAFSQMSNTMAGGLTQSIMGHQTWSRMILSFGDQMVEGMIKNSLLIMMQQDKEKLATAKSAAATAYKEGVQIGGPAGIILGPVFAAAAFAGVMAFEHGTDRVPGTGHGDTVPAMLTPGEGVVPGGVMDGLRTMARDGGFSQKPGVTVHVRPTYHVNTIDGDGMHDALEKHSDQLQRHFENTLRKMNY